MQRNSIYSSRKYIKRQKQIRVKISELKEILRKLINSEIEFEKAGKIVEIRVKEV